MTLERNMHAAPRAHAVAGAPVAALLERSDELARRWAIALILTLPFERVGEIPLGQFAREAPALCAQVLRALASEEGLERLTEPQRGGEPTPVRRVAELAGARDVQGTVRAVEALRGVLWEALLDELRWSGPDSTPARLMADLADRLAYVCSTALLATLGGSPAARGGDAPAAPARARPAVEPPPGRPLGGGVRIVDEAEDAPPRSLPTPPPAQPAAAPVWAARPAEGRPLPWEIPLAPSREQRPAGEPPREPGVAHEAGAVMRLRRGPPGRTDVPGGEPPAREHPDGTALDEPA